VNDLRDRTVSGYGDILFTATSLFNGGFSHSLSPPAPAPAPTLPGLSRQVPEETRTTLRAPRVTAFI